MKKENIKLVATDLDGTLLNEKSEISEYNKLVLQTLSKKGVEVVLCTGRPIAAATCYRDTLGFTNEMITFNGAAIINKDNEAIYNMTLEGDIGKQLISVGKKYKIYHQGLLGSRWNISNIDPWLDYYISLTKMTNYTVGFDNLTDYSFSKFMFIGERPLLLEIDKEIGEMFNDKIYKTFSRDCYLEVHNPNVSKANALNWLIERKNIKKEEIMAFGDNINDLEMLNLVNVSVAVENAEKAVKEQCKYVTKSNIENGVGHFLNEYFNLDID